MVALEYLENVPLTSNAPMVTGWAFDNAPVPCAEVTCCAPSKYSVQFDPS